MPVERTEPVNISLSLSLSLLARKTEETRSEASEFFRFPAARPAQPGAKDPVQDAVHSPYPCSGYIRRFLCASERRRDVRRRFIARDACLVYVSVRGDRNFTRDTSEARSNVCMCARARASRDAHIRLRAGYVCLSANAPRKRRAQSEPEIR